MPPVSGISPILANAWMKLAERAASTMSQSSARLAPAPAATPLTAAITGTGIARSAHQRLVVASISGAEVVGASPGAERRGHRVRRVLAGAEAAAGAGDDHAAHLGVRRGGVERAAQGLVHGGREAVQGGGTVEGQGQHRALLSDEHEGFGHVCLHVWWGLGIS